MADYTAEFTSQSSVSATLDLSDNEETDALLYYDSSKKKKDKRSGGSFLDKLRHRKKRQGPKPTQSSWNERIGFKFNKFWLFRFALRCGYARIHTFWYGNIRS